VILKSYKQNKRKRTLNASKTIVHSRVEADGQQIFTAVKHDRYGRPVETYDYVELCLYHSRCKNRITHLKTTADELLQVTYRNLWLEDAFTGIRHKNSPSSSLPLCDHTEHHQCKHITMRIGMGVETRYYPNRIQKVCSVYEAYGRILHYSCRRISIILNTEYQSKFLERDPFVMTVCGGKIIIYIRPDDSPTKWSVRIVFVTFIGNHAKEDHIRFSFIHLMRRYRRNLRAAVASRKADREHMKLMMTECKQDMELIPELAAIVSQFL